MSLFVIISFPLSTNFAGFDVCFNVAIFFTPTNRWLDVHACKWHLNGWCSHAPDTEICYGTTSFGVCALSLIIRIELPGSKQKFWRCFLKMDDRWSTVAKHLLASPILWNHWSILGVECRSRSTLLSVLLKFATTQIIPFFFAHGENRAVETLRVVVGFDDPFGGRAVDFVVDVSFQSLGNRVLPLVTWLAVGWYSNGLNRCTISLFSVPRMSM